MSTAHRIPFGIHSDGEVLDAYSVERGLGCNCICPGCKQPLMAKQGEIRVHHFSHLGDRICINGQVMALMMAAKQVLTREKRMALPDLVATVESASRYGVKRRNSLGAAQGPWQFNTVELDDAGQGTRAVVAGTTADGTTMFVVIRVSGAADAAKRDFYKQANLHAVELNLSSLLGASVSMPELTTFICEQIEHKTWIHHPGLVALEQKAIDAMKVAEPPLPAAAQGAMTGEMRGIVHAGVPVPRGQSALGRSPQWPSSRQTAKAATDDTKGLSPEILAVRREHERYRALTIEQKWDELYAGLGLRPDRWPELLDVGVNTATPPAIELPRRLWQGAVFQQFLLDVTGTSRWKGTSFYPAAVVAWCGARFGVLPDRHTDLRREVGGFLQHLANANYLQMAGEKCVVLRDQLPVG